MDEGDSAIEIFAMKLPHKVTKHSESPQFLLEELYLKKQKETKEKRHHGGRQAFPRLAGHRSLICEETLHRLLARKHTLTQKRQRNGECEGGFV